MQKITLEGDLVNIKGERIIEMMNIRNTRQLAQVLELDYPTLKDMTYHIAVNSEIITESIDLIDGDRITVVPILT